MNQNWSDALRLIQYPEFTPLVLQILKQKENFCLRERLSRDKYDAMGRDIVKDYIVKARNQSILVNNMKFDH